MYVDVFKLLWLIRLNIRFAHEKLEDLSFCNFWHFTYNNFFLSQNLTYVIYAMLKKRKNSTFGKLSQISQVFKKKKLSQRDLRTDRDLKNFKVTQTYP